MATGVSKTKWNGSIKQTAGGTSSGLDIEISYGNKKTQEEILHTKPAKVIPVIRNEGLNHFKRYNRLYYGDNLPFLSHLLKDNSVRGKIKMVYIDPPFSTKSVFLSRQRKDAYCDLLTGSHYIEFMRERLILLRELLSEDGSIYVHLDENMAFHTKVILDEIFGRKNFRNWITRKKCHPKNSTRNSYGNISDFILFYTKTNKYIWNSPYEKWTKERGEKEYSYFEEETGRRYKKVPIHAPGIRNGETGKLWRGMSPPFGKHWQFPPRKLEEMHRRGEIYWSPTGNPRRKIYLENSKGIYAQDIWLDCLDAHNQNIKITGYPTEKNCDLLRRIIKTSSNQNDIVMDCFSGSGTTLAVASELDRRWIGIDNSLEAIETTINRFLKGSQPMGDYIDISRRRNKKGRVVRKPFKGSGIDKTVTRSDNFKPICNFLFYTTKDYMNKLDRKTKNVYRKLKTCAKKKSSH